MSAQHKIDDQNSRVLTKLKKRTDLKPSVGSSAANKKGEGLAPTGTTPLRDAKKEADRIEELEKVTPGGRRKKPESEKRKHQVPLYLTDGELELLEALAEPHHMNAGRMLRILVDESGILKQ